MTDSPDTAAVLGSGSWGTALAARLAQNGWETRLWGRNPEIARVITSRHENPAYLPGVALPDRLRADTDLEAVVHGARLILIAIPTSGFREVVRRVSVPDGATVVWATKGIESGSALWLHQVLAQELGTGVPRAVLSGPSFAGEVARGLPTAVTVAADAPDVAQQVARAFHADTFRVYTSTDVQGVELGGAVKNVLAIAAGISDGLGYGANARAAIITRGLHEIMLLGEHLGASRETLIGLSGMGDLVLTCTDDQSRNRRFGLALGRGMSADAAAGEIGQAIEGRETARVLVRIARDAGVELPICEQVYRILYEGRDPHSSVNELLGRRLRRESS